MSWNLKLIGQKAQLAEAIQGESLPHPIRQGFVDLLAAMPEGRYLRLTTDGHVEPPESPWHQSTRISLLIEYAGDLLLPPTDEPKTD